MLHAFAHTMKPTDQLKVLVFHRNEARAAIIRDGLHHAGSRQIAAVSELEGIVQRVVASDIDIVLLDLQEPGAAELASVLQIVRAVNRPVVIFIDRSDNEMTKAAVEAGVSAYIIDDLRTERIRPIVEMAMSRFDTQARLINELERTKQALEDRKIIDRAKGILMARKGLSEEQAYQLLRRTAMNQERRIAEIAHNVVNAAGLLD
jgi:response regulator NasT